MPVCQQFATKAGGAWQAIAGTPSAGTGQPYSPESATTQCSDLSHGGAMIVVTASVGRQDGGYWCRRLSLALNPNKNTEPSSSAGAEDALTWANRAFMEGMRANGHNLYGQQNPYNQWVISRYGKSVPLVAMLDALASDTELVDSASGAIQTFASGTSPNSNIGMNDLPLVADMNKRYVNGDITGIDNLRLEWFKNLNNAYVGSNTTKALLAGAYQQKYGDLGMDRLTANLNDAESSYFSQPNASTDFFNYALRACRGSAIASYLKIAAS